MDFLYQKNIAPCGIAVEEIFGAEEKSPKVWKLFAMQIFSEADGDYRSIVHFDNGAPLLDSIPQRISVSHTSHHLAVASIPKTPDIDLSLVNARTVLGIDIEKEDRRQVLKVTDKFLTPEELKMLPKFDDPEKAPEDVVPAYILAWTCKEAMYKAVMGSAPDWKADYSILSLPKPAPDIKSATPDRFGKGRVTIPGADPLDLILSSWQSEDHVLTLAFSKKIPLFK